jgi:hypothetical protein
MNRLFLLSVLTLAGCASTSTVEAPMDVRGADVSRRTLESGDLLEEYRIQGQLRMVKVTPARGPAYYLYDRNGDGRMDNDKDGISPVYWKLYSW